MQNRAFEDNRRNGARNNVRTSRLSPRYTKQQLTYFWLTTVNDDGNTLLIDAPVFQHLCTASVVLLIKRFAMRGIHGNGILQQFILTDIVTQQYISHAACSLYSQMRLFAVKAVSNTL